MNVFEQSLNDLLTDVFNSILQYEEKYLQNVSGTSISIGEIHMLEGIAKENNKATVSQIAAFMNIAVPTATVAIKKLESKGFVTKVPCKADGRRTIIGLTEQGDKIYRSHRLFHRKMVRNIGKQFSDSQKEILLEGVKALDEFFKEKLEG